MRNDHPDIATLYNNIGNVYYSQGNYSQALEYFQKELKIAEKEFGKELLNVAPLYKMIGYIYFELDNFSQALVYFRKALNMWEKMLGNEHPDTKQGQGYIISCLFSAIETCQATKNMKVIKNYTSQLEESMKNRFFTAEVVEGDHQAFNRGMRGKYYVLYFEGWECTGNKNLIPYNTAMKGKPKKLVLMQDDKITEHQFGSETMGFQLGLDIITEKEKKEILEKYEKWKKSSK